MLDDGETVETPPTTDRPPDCLICGPGCCAPILALHTGSQPPAEPLRDRS